MFNIRYMDKENIHCQKEKWSKDMIEVTAPIDYPREWELDVQPLVSSHIWLQSYGLKKNKLALHQILSSIGLRFIDNFDEALNKSGSSCNERRIFSQVLQPDGKIPYSRDKLYHLEKSLLQAIYLFKRRIEWLTTESRRTFGVIEEKSVTIVLNFCSISPQQFNQYMTALESVLRQQVSQLSKFNLIRACEDMQLYSPESVPVSHDNIQNAVQWIWNLDRLAPVSNTAAVEAILKALNDKHTTAIYLYTEGTSVNKGKEILRQKVNEVCSSKDSIPVHVVSFNCDCSNTIKFLREFAESTNGRFHAYAVIMDMDTYETQSVGCTTNRANVILKRKTLGGVPPGAGVRKDVVLIFEEMEEARRNLEKLHQLKEKSTMLNLTTKGEEAEPAKEYNIKECSIKEELYMSSKEWLKSHGLARRGLGWHDIILNIAFRHTDTVVGLMHPPAAETQRDAIVEQKLVNARYCDELFPIVKLKDGQVFHVLVTPDIYRNCEKKMLSVVNTIQQRIDWLKTGSRALFGTLVEEQIYILIDTSASMQNSLNFVKQKIYVLMQEQLCHKKKFNIIAINSKAVAWKDQIVEVSEHSLRTAWSWVQSLLCSGSTNTYAAIQMAMSDPQTEAIYLLTDGRPDQPPSSIICNVKMQRQVPMHTISFNCNDVEANNFLYDLAETTGGRYHYFSEMGSLADQPKAWESMDIKDLKNEISYGLETLNELSKLRDECARLALKKGADKLRKSINTYREVDKCTCGTVSMKVLDSTEIKGRRAHCKIHGSAPKRPSTAPSKLSVETSTYHTPVSPSGIRHISRGYWGKGNGNHQTRPQQAQHLVTASYTGHNRTGYYHTRSNSGRFSPSEWMLPETKKLFQKQAHKYREVTERHISTSLLRMHISQPNKPCKIPSKTRDDDVDEKKKQTTKQWLAKHGLRAKRLTILDALGCTLVSHRTKYIPVLDKHISGKVFNEIMPMAFVSDDNQMYFFNLNGINLKEYENRVRAAVDMFREHLNSLVWGALPLSAKNEFESDGSVSFESNQVKILQLLKEADWPVKEEDINHLLNEIAKGEKYINQSKALRKAAAHENAVDNDGKENMSAAVSTLGKPHRSRSADSSVSSDLQAQDKAESSPKRTRSVSPSSSNGQRKNSGNIVSSDHIMSSTRSRPGSQSSDHSRSHSPPTTQDNIPKETPSPSSSTKSRSMSPSDRNSRSPINLISETIALTQTHIQINSKLTSDSSNEIRPRTLIKSHTQKKPLRCNAHFHSKSNKVTESEKVSNLEENPPATKDLGIVKHTHTDGQKRHIWQMKKMKALTGLVKQKQAVVTTPLQAKNEKGKVKNRSEVVKGKVHITLKSMSGQKVIARRDEDGLYYPAEVLHCPDPKSCLVHFECDDKHVLTSSVIPCGGAVSCPPLTVGDYVLVKVVRLDTMIECFVPAIIQVLPRSHSDDKLYTAIMYNGQKATTKRRYLVKISRKQFETDCAYISNQQNEKFEESQTVSPQQKIHRSRRERPDDRKKHTRPKSFPSVDVKNVYLRSQSSSSESNSRDRSQLQGRSVRDRSQSSSYSRTPPRRNPKKTLSHSSSRSSKRTASPSSLRSSKKSVSPSSSRNSEKSLSPQSSKNSQKSVSPPSSRSSKKALSPKSSRSKSNNERDGHQNELTQTMLDKEHDDIWERVLKKQKRKNKKLKQKMKRMTMELTSQNGAEIHTTEHDITSIATSQEAPSQSWWLLEQRLSLQRQIPFSKGECVLAKWTDDGWYYKGIVIHYFGNCSYEIKDNSGYTEQIWREDILQEHKETQRHFEINDRVIALHPQYSFSYAPGIIQDIAGKNIKVKFYDNEVSTCEQQDVYLVSYQKYNLDVKYIKRKENELIQSAVIARCDEVGVYLPGTVVAKHGDCNEYDILWASGTTSTQQVIHIFGAFSQRPEIHLHSHVLACSDPVLLMFLPGTVTKCQNNALSVKFCDGTRQDNLHPDQCFWLGESYFQEAIQFCKQHSFSKDHSNEV